MSFEEQVRVVWRQRLWLIGLSLLAAIAVFVVMSMRDTTYKTSAVIGVTPGPVIAGDAVTGDAVTFTSKRYERLAGSDAVLTSGAAVADKGTTLQDMRDRVSAATTPGTGIVTISVTGSGADETARVAAAVANATIAQGKTDQQSQRNDSLAALLTQRDSLRSQLDQLAADSADRAQLQTQYQSVLNDIAGQQAAPYDAAQLLQTPEVPKGPSGPGPKSLAVFAFLAALVLGGEGIIIWNRNRRRAEEAEEEEAFAPAGAADATWEPEAPAPVVAEDEGVEASPVPQVAFGELAEAVTASVFEGHRLIAVIGASDLPATNEVTLELGQQLAGQGLNALVVEGDMSHPTLASRLSIRSQAGLTDVLSGGAPPDRAQRRTSVDGLNVLPAGRALERPDVLIGVDNVQRMLSASSCDVVLITLPPAMEADERMAIAMQAHGVILAVRDGWQPERQVRAARRELGDLNNILLAVTLIDVVPKPEFEIVGRRTDRGRRPGTPPLPPRAPRSKERTRAQQRASAVQDEERSTAVGADEGSAVEASPVVDDAATVETEPVLDEPSRAEEEPVVDEPSSADEEPVVDEPSSAEEEPVVDEPSRAEEEPVVDEPSRADEEPVVDEPSSSDEEPVVDEPPSSDEPVDHDDALSAGGDETWAVEEVPAAQDLPSEPETDEATDESIPEETPSSTAGVGTSWGNGRYERAPDGVTDWLSQR